MLSSENDQGSSTPVAAPDVTGGLPEADIAAGVPEGGMAGRSRSATGETLTRRHQRAERSPAGRDEGGGAAGDPFDRWVDRQLRTLYGPVVEEPLPPRLRALLEEAGRAIEEAGDGADDGDEGHSEDDGGGKRR